MPGLAVLGAGISEDVGAAAAFQHVAAAEAGQPVGVIIAVDLFAVRGAGEIGLAVDQLEQRQPVIAFDGVAEIGEDGEVDPADVEPVALVIAELEHQPAADVDLGDRGVAIMIGAGDEGDRPAVEGDRVRACEIGDAALDRRAGPAIAR